MRNRTLQLYDFHQWANNRFFDHLEELPNKVYENEIKSVFSSIAEVIIHIYQTDGMWLSVMSGDPFEETMSVINQLKEKTANRSLGHMQKLYAKLAGEYKIFFDDFGDLSKVITIDHPQYGSLETPVSDMVSHVVNHGTYHRGNMTAMLRQQEHAGVPTDFIFYLYEIA
jgi:uncharacterized damage-inducible protein DinB